MIEVADLLRNDVLARDHIRPQERLQPKVNIYAAKHRAMQIDLVRRWVPEHLRWIFDELVKEQ